MRNNNFESALGELECAALISAPAYKFRFVTPTGVKGQSYDA